MAYKAFLLGVNTLGLRYCESDVQLMKEALTTYGYEVFLPVATKFQLLAQLEEVLDQCAKTDSFLFYFSGHGMLSKGKLDLILGDETTKQANTLSIGDVTSRLERCVAHAKLIILDCCHAGAASSDWHPDFSDVFRILTASERLEKTKEVDELKASVLTYYIHQAFVSKQSLAKIVEADHKIHINKLYQWLVEVTKQYQLTSGLQVPLPNLLGNQKADFDLATVPQAQLPQAPPEKNPRIVTIKQGLVQRRHEIFAIHRQIIEAVREMESHAQQLSEQEEEDLLVIEDFLTQQITADELTNFWQQVTTRPVETLHYPPLVDNLQRGNVVIFVNARIPQETLVKLHHYFNIDSPDSFSEVCEYVEMQHGKNLLCDKLEEYLTPQATFQILYELLASVPRPLLIISTSYDNLLEKTFTQRGKKFAVLSHPVRASKTGIVWAHYSDGKPPEEYTIESLSRSNLLEQGYSLLYKIRGDLVYGAAEKNVVLSEQDYFAFLRQIDQLIPNYLAGLLPGRSFWFIGDSPKNWEERLLIQAVLEKRQHNRQMLAFEETTSPFASIYWESRGAKHQAIHLPKLVEKLRECLG